MNTRRDRDPADVALAVTGGPPGIAGGSAVGVRFSRSPGVVIAVVRLWLLPGLIAEGETAKFAQVGVGVASALSWERVH